METRVTKAARAVLNSLTTGKPHWVFWRDEAPEGQYKFKAQLDELKLALEDKP